MNALCFLLAVFWLGLIYLASAEIGNVTSIAKYSESDESLSCEQYYSSCAEINPTVSGIQKIKVGNDIFDVYCDVTIAGKGWTVFQRRVSDEVNFYRKFSSYEKGFGDLNGNFWLGLDKLNKITSLEPQELYVHLEDFSGETAYARYSQFKVGDVYSQYKLLSLGTYIGTAGNSLAKHLNRAFYTFDRDDSNACARRRMGAWWYNNCQDCNLNALYLNGSFGSELMGCGVVWGHWKDHYYSLKTVNLMVRPLAMSNV